MNILVIPVQSVSDLITISINYEDMLDSYFDDCLDRTDIDEEYLGMIEEVRNRRDDNGYFISNSEAYKECSIWCTLCRILENL